MSRKVGTLTWSRVARASAERPRSSASSAPHRRREGVKLPLADRPEEVERLRQPRVRAGRVAEARGRPRQRREREREVPPVAEPAP
jgi:hypothetical protein